MLNFTLAKISTHAVLLVIGFTICPCEVNDKARNVSLIQPRGVMQ